MVGTVPACLRQFRKVHGAGDPMMEQWWGLGVSAMSWGLSSWPRSRAVAQLEGSREVQTHRFQGWEWSRRSWMGACSSRVGAWGCGAAVPEHRGQWEMCSLAGPLGMGRTGDGPWVVATRLWTRFCVCLQWATAEETETCRKLCTEEGGWGGVGVGQCVAPC